MGGPNEPSNPDEQQQRRQQQEWGPGPQQAAPGQPYAYPPVPHGQQPYPPPQWGPTPPGYQPPQPPPGEWGQQHQPWGQQHQPWVQQPPPETPETRKKSKAPLLIVLGLAAVIVIAIIAYFALTAADTLDQQAAEKGVQKILSDSYGVQNLSDVHCPPGQKVKKGNTFDCNLTVDGEAKKVTVTFTDDNGTYEVGRPS